MTIGEAEKHLKVQLSKVYNEREAGVITDMVLEDITGYSRIDRLVKKSTHLEDQQFQTLEQYTHQLLQHEPVQYVIGKAWFYGMELYVDKDVLIPRPETEELVEWIVNDAKANGLDVFERRASEADQTRLLKILDVGTGSGCIALGLKKDMPKAEVWACDASDRALNVARRNGSDLDIRIDFVGLDFLNIAEQKQLPTVDIVVSNPPYIPYQEKEKMNANVVQYEPHTALFVPDQDPLVFYKALCAFGKHRMHSGGKIYVEIHEDLGASAVELFEKEGYTDVVLKKDMQGKDRMIRAVII
jgi:release factor glutamine methyltransferase